MPKFRSTATDDRRASILAVAAVASAGLVPGYLVLAQRHGPDIPAFYLLIAIVLAGSALSHFLVRRGQLELAAGLIVGQAWGVTSFLVLCQGAHSSHVGAFAPVIVATSLLLRPRGTILTVALSLGVLMTAGLVNRQGAYGPAAPLFPDVTAPAVHLIFTGVFIALLVHSFSQTMAELRHKQIELKTSQDRLRRAEKMEAIGQLAGGVAHDFNNILTGMLGHIDLLRARAAELPSGEQLTEDLAALERSAERAADITSQLLTFSRKEVTDAGVANIDRALDEADAILRRLIREDVEFRVISETPGYVRLTQTGLEQVLMNLVLNASDAMPRGGAVAITTRELVVEQPIEVVTGSLQSGKYVRLSVADSGSGIPKEKLERIFEPFFTTKAIGRGTGLGLSTVLGIVQRAGGQIDVESRDGLGTTFHVYLPHALAPAPTAKHPSLPPSPPDAGVVLVCEDDATILGVLRQVLGGAGYEVESFGAPLLALSRGKELGPALSLIITDVIMPGMSGPELVLALEKAGISVPVLFISGYTAGLLSDLGIDAQDPRLLCKPFTPRDLLRRVNASRVSETNA